MAHDVMACLLPHSFATSCPLPLALSAIFPPPPPAPHSIGARQAIARRPVWRWSATRAGVVDSSPQSRSRVAEGGLRATLRRAAAALKVPVYRSPATKEGLSPHAAAGVCGRRRISVHSGPFRGRVGAAQDSTDAASRQPPEVCGCGRKLGAAAGAFAVAPPPVLAGRLAKLPPLPSAGRQVVSGRPAPATALVARRARPAGTVAGICPLSSTWGSAAPAHSILGGQGSSASMCPPGPMSVVPTVRGGCSLRRDWTNRASIWHPAINELASAA
eukprot:scaffold2020_cov107-Isochrysis_galbana.AAC.9